MSLLEPSGVLFGLHISHRQKNCVLVIILLVSIPALPPVKTQFDCQTQYCFEVMSSHHAIFLDDR